ncbi:hypothetical protein LXL04_025768 [Taraxacum kok-saghyz]
MRMWRGSSKVGASDDVSKKTTASSLRIVPGIGQTSWQKVGKGKDELAEAGGRRRYMISGVHSHFLSPLEC